MLKELIQQQAAASNEIHTKVEAFLGALDKAGGFAPTITTVRGGAAYLGDITVEGDEVVIAYTLSYSGGDQDIKSLRVPVVAVEDPSEVNIAAYLASESEKARKAQLVKDAESITTAKNSLWSPVQSLKRLGVPLAAIFAEVEADYNWVDPNPKAQIVARKK